jgi:hypothetical protein
MRDPNARDRPEAGPAELAATRKVDRLVSRRPIPPSGSRLGLWAVGRRARTPCQRGVVEFPLVGSHHPGPPAPRPHPLTLGARISPRHGTAVESPLRQVTAASSEMRVDAPARWRRIVRPRTRDKGTGPRRGMSYPVCRLGCGWDRRSRRRPRWPIGSRTRASR